jgi:hypothetical protein
LEVVSSRAEQENGLIAKIRELPVDRVAEVEDFVDFLRQRGDRRLLQAATKLSEEAFQKVWSNPDDADYDRL